MTAEPLVSCVIPVFNAERFLDATLRSVFAQTHSRLEIIAVDDGSTDGSARVLERHADRIRIVSQPNRGEAAARNAGVAAASGEFVAFLDADDLWKPDKTRRQLNRILEHPRIDLSFTAFRNFPDAVDASTPPQAAVDADNEPPSTAWSVCTLVARRDVFTRFGPFDEHLRSLPNMTWFVRAAGRGATIDVLPEVLMRRRIHAASSSNRTHGVHNHDELLPMLKAWRDLRRSESR